MDMFTPLLSAYFFLFLSLNFPTTAGGKSARKNQIYVDSIRVEIESLKNFSTSSSCDAIRKADGILGRLLPGLLNQQHDAIATGAKAYADLFWQNVSKEQSQTAIFSLLRTFLGLQQQLTAVGYVYRYDNTRRLGLYTAQRLYTGDNAAIHNEHSINTSWTIVTESQASFNDWNTIQAELMQRNSPNATADDKGIPGETLALQKHCPIAGEENSDTPQWRVVLVVQLPSIKSDQAPPMFYVTFPLNAIDLNQCDDSANDMLRSTHGCANSSLCVFIPGGGFELGHYECCCQKRNASSASNLIRKGRKSYQKMIGQKYDRCIDGRLVEKERIHGRTFPTRCADYYQSNYTLRGFLLAVNIVFALAAFALIFVVTTQRKVKDWGSRGWALMEFFLIGAILLYSIVILEYFQPSTASCCLVLWCRELGFVLFYGTVVLKIHRNLFEHGVRKANYVFIKEKDLLKYLLCIVAFTTVGLLSWTVTATQAVTGAPLGSSPVANSGNAMITTGRTKMGDIYMVCTFFHWNLIWHALEFVFLSYGAYLSYNARVITWNERNQFAAAVLLEMVVSMTAIIVKKHMWLDSNPDALLLLSFLHTHSTVTVALVLIMATKLHYAKLGPTARDHSTASSGAYRMHPSLAKLRDNLMNGTLDLADMPIGELNPEDIRAELKRVYTQLRMYKLTHLYMDNPHISKRKGGKKTSNRQTNRRFSIPTVPSKTSHKEMTKQTNPAEDECSSLTKGLGDEEGASAGSYADVTIHTSPHNVFFSKTTSNALENKLKLDSELSVCI